jgi:D-threonate/D-erythronate kinase
MTPRIAIIADDLTGALDTSTPFALHGLRVAAPLMVEDIDEALGANPDVIAINTASRALEREAAASRVQKAAERLLGVGRPEMIFKKIDSRLKGNIAAECASVAKVFGFQQAVIAPAVPDQERFTVGGAIAGRGIDMPLAIAPFFDGLPFEATIRDARSDGDLDEIAAHYAARWDRTLAIGARGLGGALAQAMGGGAGRTTLQLSNAEATLFAFGSTDPITLAQIEALRDSVDIREAPGGVLPAPDALRLPLMLHITGERMASPDAVAARFADGVVDHIAALGPANLVMGGGDTTLAILQRLGTRVLFPVGEAAAGLPAFDTALPDSKLLRCVAKSGGFGPPDVLARLLQRERRSAR